MKVIRVVSVCVVMSVIFAACGNDKRPEATTATTASSPTPTATPCSVPNASTEAQSTESTVAPAPVTDVKYTAEGCPRITFEFDTQAPGYLVEYASPPFSMCGMEGDFVPEGWGTDAYLRIQLQPALIFRIDEGATYDGPRDIPIDGNVLKHLKFCYENEAMVEWIVGLDDRHDFSARVLDQPARLVIDISEFA
jgi:hypothetical protein